MHGYVVPSRIGTFACTTLQLEFSVYSGKKPCKNKYVKILELINKVKKKKHGSEVVNVLGFWTFGTRVRFLALVKLFFFHASK